MNYQFHDDESVRNGVRRIAMAELDGVIAAIEKQDAEVDDTIHRVRVAFKKMRALLRLVRGAMPHRLYRAENRCFRDAGRRLSTVRDTVVPLETLEHLMRETGADVAAKTVAAVRGALVQARERGDVGKRAALGAVAAVVAEARERVREWPIDGSGFEAIHTGLKRVYADGRRAMSSVEAHATARNVHEWRKLTKHLLYQVQLLIPTWPELLKRYAREVQRLSDCLSEHHDLTVLRERIAEHAGALDGGAELHALTHAIDQRRTELAAEALNAGAFIYAETPRAYSQRMKTYWESQKAKSER